MRGQGTPHAASSVSDGVSDVGTGQAVHGASQAPETDCYREAQRLRAGIRAMIEGNYPHPRSYRPKRCPHGVEYYQDCVACDTEYLEGLLK